MSMLAAEHVVPGWREAIEEYYARGWTDGLPVVPATADGVQPFLDEVGLDPDHVVLTEPVRRRTITAGKVAITRITLRPRIMFGGERSPSSEELDALHHAAHEQCFIANSLRSEIVIEPA